MLERFLKFTRATVERLKKHIRELQAEVNEFKFHTTESHALLKGFNDKVGAMKIKIDDLKKALDTSVERFKRSEEYHSLLKGDTSTLLRSFCQRVSVDYPSIASHFTTFVTALGEDYVVSLFDELPEEEPIESEVASESSSSEDEADEESYAP
ncbi:hypothetical protein LIER_12492 [Lithospermum erythrorhizon]|uniref:Uncharacterized protein n=1 Tax=Lithospermum erythrorhizon TaxID=34254 RepID=A0AAV3PX63_LITER